MLNIQHECPLFNVNVYIRCTIMAVTDRRGTPASLLHKMDEGRYFAALVGHIWSHRKRAEYAVTSATLGNRVNATGAGVTVGACWDADGAGRCT